MSETERIHEPSPVHLFRAREEGLVARSAELTRSLLICSALGALLVFSGTLVSVFGNAIVDSLTNVTTRTSDIWTQERGDSVGQPFLAAGAFMLAILALSVFLWQIQSPLQPKFSNATPKLSRISLLSGWGRIFSTDNLGKTLLALAGFAGLLFTGFQLVIYHPEKFVELMQGSLSQNLNRFSAFLQNSFMATGLVILFLGGVEYVMERHKISTQLKQTDEEKREEARQQEMNPELRRNLLSRD